MPANALFSLWIALPSILLSLLTTCLLVRALSVDSSAGLLTVAKATVTFLVILVLSCTSAKTLFHATPDLKAGPKQEPSKQLGIHALSESNMDTFNRVSSWRSDVDNAMESELSFTSTNGEVWVDNRAKVKKRNKEREEERRAKKALRESLKPKRAELLGVKKETIVEVLSEDQARDVQLFGIDP